MRKQPAIIAVMFLLLGGGALSACIQPVDPTPAPTPTSPSVVTSPLPPPAQPGNDAAPAASSPSLVQVEQFVQSRGDAALNLSVYYSQGLGQDQVIGFRYENGGGLPCAGWLLFPPVSMGQQPINGGLVCTGDPAQSSFVGWTPFLTSDGQPFTVVVGRVGDPSITAVAAINAGGASVDTFVSNSSFLMLENGVQEIVTATAINAQGNTVIAALPQQVVR